MSKVILITGGVKSGKSKYGESLLASEKDVLYIATSVVTDEEMKLRVDKHKKRRNKSWSTYEGYKGLAEVIENDSHKNIMFECVGTMINNIMYEINEDFDHFTDEQGMLVSSFVRDEFDNIIKTVRKQEKNIIIITNDVGFSLLPVYKSGRIFTDILGNTNQFIGNLSDEIYLVVCGRPINIML